MPQHAPLKFSTIKGSKPHIAHPKLYVNDVTSSNGFFEATVYNSGSGPAYNAVCSIYSRSYALFDPLSHLPAQQQLSMIASVTFEVGAREIVKVKVGNGLPPLQTFNPIFLTHSYIAIVYDPITDPFPIARFLEGNFSWNETNLIPTRLFMPPTPAGQLLDNNQAANNPQGWQEMKYNNAASPEDSQPETHKTWKSIVVQNAPAIPYYPIIRNPLLPQWPAWFNSVITCFTTGAAVHANPYRSELLQKIDISNNTISNSVNNSLNKNDLELHVDYSIHTTGQSKAGLYVQLTYGNIKVTTNLGVAQSVNNWKSNSVSMPVVPKNTRLTNLAIGLYAERKNGNTNAGNDDVQFLAVMLKLKHRQMKQILQPVIMN